MFLVAASLLSGAFGGLLAAGFLSAAPIGTLTTWRAIFLCEGIMTVAIGIIAIFIFPSDITTTKLFNEEERALAINRILADMPAARTTKEKTRLGVMKTTINGVVNLLLPLVLGLG